jgi:hypothetical protein
MCCLIYFALCNSKMKFAINVKSIRSWVDSVTRKEGS